MSIERIEKNQHALNPNILQSNASNPAASVWVSASAGTGKTKVLTDRILRLLLPQEDGSPGCAPNKILGLTFTKAAASEMAIRISETLSEWTIADEQKLVKKIKDLLGRTPNPNDIAAARELYTNVIDTPGRLKIMTIHAFCQSVLSRFPLESNLTPGFKVADDRKAFEFLDQAKSKTFAKALANNSTPLGQALNHLSRTITEDQLSQLIGAVISERGQLEKIIKKHFSIEGIYTALCTSLDILPDQSSEDILAIACKDENFEVSALKYYADIMANGQKTDIKNAALMRAFLTCDEANRIKNFHSYALVYLKKDNDNLGDIRANFVTKNIREQHLDITQAMQDEAERLRATLNAMKSADIASLTRDLLYIAKDTLEHYEAIKAQHNILDYEDLIFKTKHLVQTQGSWVHYKLDQGIDHILIDEAQDTNPEQWQIIESLCYEFFASHSQQENHRTVFTVGDEKQSIYSFQRASPEEFDRMRKTFAQKIQAANLKWAEVDLNISFRSSKSVLAAVDATFKKPEIAKGLGIGNIEHESYRKGQEGIVELWPLFENDQDNENTPTWSPPIEIENFKSGSTKCAEHIAETIKGWLENGDTLTSYDRAIEPGDIMILVRTRNAFVNQLIRALKTRNIPVGGLDRIVLNDQLAVQDMLAAADFSLLQNDDLNLACLLKSPLINMDEETLFDLAYDRNETLWSALQKSAHKNIVDYLKSLIGKSKILSPYEFFSSILQSPEATGEKSGLNTFQERLGIDALDALDELLNAAINFEHENTASLQNFVQWQRSGANGGTDIKRQTDSQNNQVRIMTVHGSKGLQSPIVFLPDTVSTPGLNSTQAGNRLLWPSQTGKELPIWAPRKEYENNAYTTAKDNVLERLDEEYRRLLYVAMTRAEDRLYVTGYKGSKDINDKCWYTLIKNGLQATADSKTTEDKSLLLCNVQSEDPDRSQSHEEKTEQLKPIPEWMYNDAPKEPQPPTPLIPSRPSEPEPTALSPLEADDNYRFRRGNITHKLLQFLPDLPNHDRPACIENYLKTHANDLPEAVQKNISEEILKILNDESFAPLFGAGSRAEVPITGLLPDGRLISGQIDRLLITDTDILIIDFKSNRPPPTQAKDVPNIYYKQLKSYAEILKFIYPDRKIRCALLWTDGPNLMPINIEA